MSVLMRPTLFPTLFRQGNFKLLRYLSGTKNLELSRLIHSRFIVFSPNDYILDWIDVYPTVGPQGYKLNDHASEVHLLFKSMASDHDDSCLSSDYYEALMFSSRLKHRLTYPLLGRQCHGYLLKSGLVLHQYVKASLVRLYTMVSDVVGAMEVLLLSNPPKLDTGSYNLILFGFIEKGYLDEALIILRRKMLAKDIVWNLDTYIAIFGLSSRVEYMKLGRRIHKKLLKSDLVASDKSVWNALILFEFIEKGYLNEALNILRRKMLAGDMVWNKETYIVVFGLCARLEDLKLGRQVHNKLLKSDVVDYDESVCKALIKMYGKCKEILSARKLFDMCELIRVDVVIWNTILAAYSRHGSFEELLNLFNDMQREDVVPNETTFCSLLTASAELFSLRCGNSLHALVVKTGFKGCRKLEDTLINMYSRTGDITAAEKVFLGMTDNRDIYTWNAMICGYSLHSYGNKSLALFQEMFKLGEDDPDGWTFVGVLRACGHMGHVEEGLYYYYKLMKHKGVKPVLKHGMCIINMLIKAGELNEALSFIVSTLSKWHVKSWTTFLRGCHDHGNYDLGIRAAELIPDNVATKVSKWFAVTQVSEVMEIMDTKEERGWCWMEMNDEIIRFSSVQKGDPNFTEVHKKMKAHFDIINHYTNMHDNDIEDVLKGDRKDYHSEEIAVAFSKLNRPGGSQINIIKTSGKICADSHTLMKLNSKATSDTFITVRDEYQFHNFRDGHCSCDDYW